MRTPSPTLSKLSTVPIDTLLDAAATEMRHATLDEIAIVLSGKPTVTPNTSQLAEMILALPEKGSKLERVQAAVVAHAVAVCNGNVSAAARLLGMERKSLERKIARARRLAAR
jgi:ActR/RegA family two-component response regulator